MFRKFAGFLAAIFVSCMLAFLLISIYVSPAQGTLGFELATTLLQVGVVSVIGAFISMFTFEYQREKNRDLERRKDEYREERLKTVLNQATEAYSAVKKARLQGNHHRKSLLRFAACLTSWGTRSLATSELR